MCHFLGDNASVNPGIRNKLYSWEYLLEFRLGINWIKFKVLEEFVSLYLAAVTFVSIFKSCKQ